MYCIAFYPFRAYFSLYYHILLSNDQAEYEEDVQRLKDIGKVTSKAAKVRCEWEPIAKAILSLNRMTDHVRQRTQPPQNDTADVPLSISREDQSLLPLAQMEHGNAAELGNDNMPFSWPPDFGDMHFATTEAFQEAAAQPDFRPLEYMQMLENQFAGHDLNYGLWEGEMTFP
jgi:hypothetical protein